MYTRTHVPFRVQPLLYFLCTLSDVHTRVHTRARYGRFHVSRTYTRTYILLSTLVHTWHSYIHVYTYVRAFTQVTRPRGARRHRSTGSTWRRTKLGASTPHPPESVSRDGPSVPVVCPVTLVSDPDHPYQTTETPPSPQERQDVPTDPRSDRDSGLVPKTSPGTPPLT